MTWPTPPRRATALVALVTAALLSSAYAIGRSLAVDPSRQHATGVAGDLSGPRYTHQPGSPGTARGDRSADSPEAGPDATATAGGGVSGAQAVTGTRQVALTFDDGPDPRYTPQVLAVLRQFRVHATFCVVGENAQRYPELVQAIVADGHTLCNHSWNHNLSLSRRSPGEIRADLLRANAAIRAAVPDAPICWYRQPGGMWSYPVVSAAHELGMTS
ncbi:polysaccharide deacetylase family protein, partial [Micromonospora sp. NPDC007271]|uniref:polysaccharide deacetylase family protein n=1 Tax=Micromonospora sp. NPDC007271 TaxID=3154587 RepID=UPI0033F6E4F2